jgi:uncharacterized protein YerC
VKRYGFLDQRSVYEALNMLRHAFLAAKDGKEVDKIIRAVLTFDERMRLGRRIQIAQRLRDGETFNQIVNILKVGNNTIHEVSRLMEENPEGYELINRREIKVEKTYRDKAYSEVGGSKLWFKPKVYSGFKRSDVKR